jgi:prepilin-type N-terminal cleavage/methylation domain-containing protein
MYADGYRRPVHTIRAERGFSLIELGIVIAVIAVLAAVVIFGRGFINSARITQGVNAANSVRKGASSYAGLQGGTLPSAGTAGQADDIVTLGNRSLLPVQVSPWYVSGSSANQSDSVQITKINMGTAGNLVNGVTLQQNAVAISYTMPSPTMAADLYTAVQNDPNFVKNGAEIGSAPSACASAVPTTASVVICFYL